MADDEMVAWLTACLDEIERTAQTAAETQPGGGVWQYAEAITVMQDRVEAPDGTGRDGMVAEIVSDRPGEHIALHDPRAVLARVEAERAIIRAREAELTDRLAMLDWYHERGEMKRFTHDWERGRSRTQDQSLRLLAYGHRFDAPGYQTKWSPAGIRDEEGDRG